MCNLQHWKGETGGAFELRISRLDATRDLADLSLIISLHKCAILLVLTLFSSKVSITNPLYNLQLAIASLLALHVRLSVVPLRPDSLPSKTQYSFPQTVFQHQGSRLCSCNFFLRLFCPQRALVRQDRISCCKSVTTSDQWPRTHQSKVPQVGCSLPLTSVMIAQKKHLLLHIFEYRLPNHYSQTWLLPPHNLDNHTPTIHTFITIYLLQCPHTTPAYIPMISIIGFLLYCSMQFWFCKLFCTSTHPSSWLPPAILRHLSLHYLFLKIDHDTYKHSATPHSIQTYHLSLHSHTIYSSSSFNTHTTHTHTSLLS